MVVRNVFLALNAAVVEKTRIPTTSKICPFLLTLIAHVESGQILIFVGILVFSTTIFTTINTYYTHNFVYKMYIASIIYAFHTLIFKSSQASFKPNFISNMPNYIEINQVNHLTKFFFNRIGWTENNSKLLRNQ